MKYLYYYETVIGKIGLAEEYGFLTNLCFMNVKQPLDAKVRETELLKEAFLQIHEYLKGERKEFDIPLNPQGSKFQQTVWSELLNIPYGEVRSYKVIASSIGSQNSARAIGSANNKNPIPIIIPCHRVISADGNISGYTGGSEIKEFLLKLEKENV